MGLCNADHQDAFAIINQGSWLKTRGVGPCWNHKGYVGGQPRVLIVVFGKPEERVRARAPGN